ncbi:MAG: hypothetical protein QNJ77_02810 [Acidimicrobiia bacterium]|nr:hypothetical protein [Acidimicrobiia bacterium]
MGRLPRFAEHRFVGTRDTMRVHDCDNEAEHAALEERFADDELLRRNLLQTFAPDTLAEARNRGFRPS